MDESLQELENELKRLTPRRPSPALMQAFERMGSPDELAAAFAFLVAFGGVAAVLLYRYVDVGAIGPLPDMYDASWYSEKTWSAIAEAAAAVAAFWLFFLEPRRRSVTPPAASS